MNVFSKKIVASKAFNIAVAIIILINCILIGIEQSYQSELISLTQDLCIVLFIIEILTRWFARNTVISFLKKIWNIIDLTLIIVSLVPESLFLNSDLLTMFRIVRVVRIIRLIKVFPETLAILKVVENSFAALLRIISLLIILMYFYALVGVILFKGKTHISNKFNDIFDPFGDISEALFSLFRVTTGEDWTDLRYDLLSSDVSSWIVNIYFVSWLILSAFFLLNIIIGAVVKNYDNEYSKNKTQNKMNK